MDKSDIGEYVLSNLKRGLSLEEVRQQLLSRGFFDYDIDSAISKLDLSEYKKKEEKKEPKKEETIEGWDEDLPKI